ncbi:MAG TPA: DUF5906 domain-containing protein [Candidatus Absconditabacterales bacterium]|nr:DUF5906 domain-containing protein [Candidatus Absconditabacterales bacterium]
MDNLQKINEVPFLNIFQKLGIATKKDTTVNEYRIQVPGEGRISNGSYKLNIQKNAVYANGQSRPQGQPFNFVKEHFNCDEREVFKWFEENFSIKGELEKPRKNVKKEDILKNFSDYMIGSNFTQEVLGGIKTWLVNRGFSHEYVNSDEGLDRIYKVFKNIGYCSNPATRPKSKTSKEWLDSKPVLIFPALDQNGNITGVKMRKTNNLPEDESSKDSKSINVTGSKSGVIYHSLSFVRSSQNLIIVEGEPDYIVMRMLGYDNVIGNLGGVNSCREIIRDLTKMVSTVIIAYDNDQAGREGGRKLSEFCKRKMFYIQYIERNNVYGNPYKDINEYLEGGFNFDDFEKMLTKATEIKMEDDGRGSYNSQESKSVLAMENKNPFIYLRRKFEYYDIYENQIIKPSAVSEWTGMDSKEIKEARMSGEIKTFYDVCYWKGGKKNHYNILDERVILQPSENPEIHPEIDFLMRNLCGNREENIQWLHQAILYKYANVNDVLVPAVLFKGVGGSGKGTFMRLLSAIFSEENVMRGLGTRSLISDFCPYTGNKIVVEINELGGGNHRDAVQILDRLKSLVFEPRIMVNMKGIQPREVGNIAWFIMSSNHQRPLRLDSGESGNRRFSVINTGPEIKIDRGNVINNLIKDKKVVADYLAWLFKTYPDVITWKCITALDNEDKRILTEASENVPDKFFTWLLENYPDIRKISVRERDVLLYEYRSTCNEHSYIYDKKYSIEYFNANLPHHVSNKKVSIRGKTVSGIFIDKPIVNTNIPAYFVTPEIENRSIL